MITARGFVRHLASLGLIVVLSGCGTGSSSTPDLSERSLAAVYRGPAACQGCPEAAASLLEESGGFTVLYIGPNESRSVTAEGLADLSLYVQPGGFDDVGLAMEHLGKESTDAITDWVKGGGRYLGFCMGAYLAGSDPGMGLLSPGDTTAYAESAESLVNGSEEAVIPVEWDDELRYQYAQDAAVITESGVAGERVLSRFTNGTVNALVRPVGDGAVGVVGTHPEATADWFTPDMAQADTDGLDHAQALALVDALLKVG